MAMTECYWIARGALRREAAASLPTMSSVKSRGLRG